MKVQDMCLYALFAILIAVGAFVKVPVSIVPITLQTLFVILTALILRKRAVYSVLLYIIMGLVGLPVFTNGGGLSYVFVPSFGYLIGFVISSYFIGSYQMSDCFALFIRCFIGLIIIYIVGMIYFVFIQFAYYHQVFSMSWIVVSLCLIYLPGDLLSIIIAIIIYQRVQFMIPQ
ncbi:biotin transporter BioY [Candidatus Stoquefichus massiliensis]|uniref:biotin transporter BioY n=1 Tax=Candidatus Stoquefichus massiliensis TaxID=1470350 RepID=UPI0004809498|nr:biotin transporter BioY [Candidatus Stoquefichus massiliensis]